MAPCRRELFGFKTTDTLGKALAKVRFKAQKKGRRTGLQLALLPIDANISREFRDEVSNSRDFDTPFKSTQSANNRTRVPVSEPLDIIIDSNDAQSSTHSDPDKEAHEWLKKRRLEYLFTASRPSDELHICSSLREPNFYKDEGMAVVLKNNSRNKNLKHSVGRGITRRRRVLPIGRKDARYDVPETESTTVESASIDNVLEAMSKRFNDITSNPVGKLGHVSIQALESYGIYLHAVSKAAYNFIVGDHYRFPRNGCALFDTQEFPAKVPAVAYIAQCFYEKSPHPCLVVTSPKKRVSWLRKCRQMCKDINVSCGPLKEGAAEDGDASTSKSFTLFVLTYEQFIDQIDTVTENSWRGLFIEADLNCLLSTLAPVLPQISQGIRSQSRYLLIQNCTLPRNFDGLEKYGSELLPFFFVDQMKQMNSQEDGIKMIIRKLSTPTPEVSQGGSNRNIFPSCISRFPPLMKLLYLNTFHPNMVSRNIVRIREVDLPANLPKEIYISELLRPIIPELKLENDGFRTRCIMTLCLEDRRLAETVMVNNGLRGAQLQEHQRIPVFPLTDTWHKIVYILGRYDDLRITDAAIEMFRNSEALQRYGDREIIFLCPSGQSASLEEAQVRFDDDGRNPNLTSSDFVNELLPKVWMGMKFQVKSTPSYPLDNAIHAPTMNQKNFEYVMNEAADYSLPATRRPKIRRTNVRHEEIREYIEQVEEKQPESATPRDRARPPPKKRQPPTKAVPVPQAANPPPVVRRIPERFERLRRLVPMMATAVSNLTPFGPPVDRSLLRKYMLEQAPLDVSPIDCYLTAKTVVRFSAFGSYYRHALYGGQVRKTLAHFFSWECATAFYGIICRKFPHQKSKVRINKQFLSKFFKKNMILRFFKKDGFPLTRVPMEREMLTFMLGNGITFDFRTQLMKALVDPEGKITELELKSEKKGIDDYSKEHVEKKEEGVSKAAYFDDVLNIIIEREDRNYWCSLAIRKPRNSDKTLTAKNDFYDFFSEDLYSFLDSEIERSEHVADNKKKWFASKFEKPKRSAPYTVRGTAKTATATCLRKMRPTPSKSAMDEDALSSGAGPSSNETARDISTLERPLEDSQMDIDTPLEDSQLPNTPFVERPPVDEDDEVPLSNVPHIGPSCLRYPAYRIDKPFDSFPGRRLAARVYGDSINLAFGNELLSSFNVEAQSSDSEDDDEYENVAVRKRNLDENMQDEVPSKVSKSDDPTHEKVAHATENVMELGEEVKPEYLKPEFAPTFKKQLRTSFIVAGDLQSKISMFSQLDDFKKDHRYDTASIPNSDPRRTYNRKDFIQPLAGFSNYASLAEDSAPPNNNEMVEDLLGYYASMQRHKELYNNHEQLASDLDLVNIDWELRKYFELAVTSRMPDNLPFSFDNSCLNMPIYGRTLPKDAKIEILPHGVDNSSGKAYLSPFHSAPHMGPVCNIMSSGISSPFKPIPQTSNLHASPSHHVLDSSELHHLLLRKLGYEQELPVASQDIKVEIEEPAVGENSNTVVDPARGTSEEQNESQAEASVSGPTVNESGNPQRSELEGTIVQPKSEVPDPESTTSASSIYRSQIGLQEKIIESPQKSESVNEKFKPKDNVMYSPQPGAIFELIENIADKYPDWVELITNKDDTPFSPTLIFDVACRIFKDELEIKGSLNTTQPSEQHSFSDESEIWRPFLIAVFADRTKISTTSKERFLEKNHLLLLQRSFSRNELITILKQCEIKYALNVSGMFQNPKKMTQYDIRVSASLLKTFVPRANLRELKDDIDYSIKRRRTPLQRSQSLEPPRHLKSYIRRRSASISHPSTSGEIESRPLESNVEAASEIRRRYVFRRPKSSISKRIVKKPESYMINLLKILGDDGEKTGASSYHCRRFRRKTYVSPGNVRWRYTAYVDDRWKSFRIDYKSAFSLAFINYCQINAISN